MSKQEAAEALAVEYITALLLGDTKGMINKPGQTCTPYQLLVRWRWQQCRALGINSVKHLQEYVQPAVNVLLSDGDPFDKHPSKLWAMMAPNKETV